MTPTKSVGITRTTFRAPPGGIPSNGSLTTWPATSARATRLRGTPLGRSSSGMIRSATFRPTTTPAIVPKPGVAQAPTTAVVMPPAIHATQAGRGSRSRTTASQRLADSRSASRSRVCRTASAPHRAVVSTAR